LGEGRDFNFLEINLRGDEYIFNNVKKLADLFDGDKKIIIKQNKAINTSVCPFDEKYFLINLDISIFHLCDAENLKLSPYLMRSFLCLNQLEVI